MTEAVRKLRYRGGILGMRQLARELGEQGLQVTVKTGMERRDAVATIEAIITFASIPGTLYGLADLTVKAKSAISKFRETSRDSSADIDILDQGDEGPDDAGFLP
jgi:hypothetical protein